MKLVILAAANSIHTLRWANGLQKSGIDVHVISQQAAINGFVKEVSIHILPNWGVFGYLIIPNFVKRLLNEINPDLVNAHYASGYGTTAHLVNFRPWLLSVWGSDVFDFPYKSPVHKWVVVSNLKAADAVASTSHCMAVHTRKLAPKLRDIAVTPFGVDCNQFCLHKKSRCDLINPSSEHFRPIVIGTVKNLSHKYGIDVLIAAFALARNSLVKTDAALAERLRLRIVGGGPNAEYLQKLAEEKKVADVTEFVGAVVHDQVPAELNQLDIYVALSRQESFGVAAIEAGAVGLPVVVSDAGGLSEVVLHGQTGFVVPKENAQAAADALLQLIQNPNLREKLGRNGRQHVLAHYSWDACITNMIALYKRVMADHKRKLI